MYYPYNSGRPQNPKRVKIRVDFYPILIVLLLILATGSAQARWGAFEPSLTEKPATSWLSRFATKADVVATHSIANAIAQCDTTVGRNNYCVVELRESTKASAFTVNRSKTKIVATPQAAPINALPNQATVAIHSNTEKVLLENLTLVGTRSDQQPIYAIVVSGQNIRDIVIRKNRIYNYDSDASAHGIVILGSGATQEQRIHRITIDRNHLHDMRTGSSETIAINGNVSHWVISNNVIERVNNIAIDAIGGEGTAPPVVYKNRVLPGTIDAARNGWIEKNRVSSMSTSDNPAYGNKHSWAAAIYVDGGRSISIVGNSVKDTPWAFDIGAENCVITENITLRNNRAHGSHFGDLRLGGYSTTGFLAKNNAISCDPRITKDINEGHGYVRRLTIADNHFLSANTLEPRILVEYRTTQSIIAEPGIEPEHSLGDGSAAGDGNAYLTTE